MRWAPGQPPQMPLSVDKRHTQIITRSRPLCPADAFMLLALASWASLSGGRWVPRAADLIGRTYCRGCEPQTMVR